MKPFKKITTLLVFLFISLVCFANVRLPKLLGSNMVLQRDKPITLWGWADAGEKIMVQFNQQTKTIKADKNGKWLLSLTPESAGGPYTLTVKGKNSITLTNILVGEVWVCSGQSNMEWPVRLANNAEKEIQAGNFPTIRHFTVEKSMSTTPEEELKGGEWKVCTPETVGDFTAVGYFFAREAYNKTKVPIGLINTSWGGTHSETWTSREAFEQDARFKDMIASMPNLNMAEIALQKNEAIKKRLASLNLVLPSSTEIINWKGPADDSQWPTMAIPQPWENQLGELDGTIWFRKTVTLSSEDSGKAATLELSMIDDTDETFVNGTAVGSTNSYNTKRNYDIRAGILKEGKNIISIKVVDTGGGGGIYGKAKEIQLVIGSKILPLAGEWRYNIESLLSNGTVSPNSYPTLLFNAMLNPLINFSIRGALWYQGESNAGRAYQYRAAFPLMIQDWRKHFKQGDFPFYFVQLASFNSANGNSEKGSAWAELREAQTMTLSLNNTGMAVTTDIGEATDIHPRNKQDVGIRLAAIALNRLYDKKMIDSGPAYQAMKVEGNKIRITLTNIGSGLIAHDKYGYLKGFEIAGSDQKFQYAKAWIEGSEVVVANESITQPKAVRFAWADNPEDANLFNKEGFPAVPFRTDSWMTITESATFKID